MNLAEHELAVKKRKLTEIAQECSQKKAFIEQMADDRLSNEITTTLRDQMVHYKKIVDTRTQRKLCRLYGGWIPLPLPSEGYVNLSSVTLTDDQKELLNLGLNYAYSPRFCALKKTGGTGSTLSGHMSPQECKQNHCKSRYSAAAAG